MERLAATGHRQPSAVGQGVAGVDSQVQQDLIEHTRVGLHRQRLGGGPGLHIDRFLHGSAQHAARTFQHVIEINGPAPHHRLARVGE